MQAVEIPLTAWRRQRMKHTLPIWLWTQSSAGAQALDIYLALNLGSIMQPLHSGACLGPSAAQSSPPPHLASHLVPSQWPLCAVDVALKRQLFKVRVSNKLIHVCFCLLWHAGKALQEPCWSHVMRQCSNAVNNLSGSMYGSQTQQHSSCMQGLTTKSRTGISPKLASLALGAAAAKEAPGSCFGVSLPTPQRAVDMFLYVIPPLTR